MTIKAASPARRPGNRSPRFPFPSRSIRSALASGCAALALSCAALSAAGLPASAQNRTESSGTAAAERGAPQLPSILERWSDLLTYAGRVGGLESWTIDGQGGMIMLAPDQATILLGNVFGSRGQDLGAAYSGAPARALSDMIEPTAAPSQPAKPGDLAASDDARILSLVEEQEQAISDADSSLPAIFREAERFTSSPKPAGGVNPLFEMSRENPPPAASTLPSDDDGQPVPDLSSVETDAFWMIVGNSEAPAVYVFIDPTCPFCGQAMAGIQKEVEAGKIHLRVILTPFRSKEALDLAAAILTDEQPPVAFWRHEIEKGLYQRNGIEPVPAEKLGRKGIQLLERNVTLMRDLQVPGVPFFLHMEDGKWKPSFGVTASSVFLGADTRPLPDKSYMNFPRDLSPFVNETEGAAPAPRETAPGANAVEKEVSDG